MVEKDRKWLYISIASVLIMLILGMTTIFVNRNPFEIKFDMQSDEEMVEVFKIAYEQKCVDDKIRFCEDNCKVLFNRYESSPNTICVGNWCKADCFKICYEEYAPKFN